MEDINDLGSGTVDMIFAVDEELAAWRVLSSTWGNVVDREVIRGHGIL